MVQYANDQGILVLLTGLMEPLDGASLAQEPYLPPLESSKVFARNLAARFAGSHVVLSPGFDDNPANTTLRTQIDAVGRDLDLSFSNLLLANHTGTYGLSEYTYVHDMTWVDFQLFQSGFAENVLSEVVGRPTGLIPSLLALRPEKVVVNAEGIYDYGYHSDTETYFHFNDFRARQAAWLSMLSGAAGVTHGSAGLWDWGICGLTNPEPWVATYETCKTLRNNPQPTPQEAMAAPLTAVDSPRRWGFRFLRAAMITTGWTGLLTNSWEQSRIRNQPPEVHRQMRLARSRDWLVAYLPHNSWINLDLAGTGLSPAVGSYMWLAGLARDPQARFVPGVLQADGSYRFNNPDWGQAPKVGLVDEALSIQRATSASFGWDHLGRTARIQAWPNLYEVQGAVLEAVVLTAEGEAIGKPFIVATTGKEMPRSVEAARDGEGTFILVWEEKDSGTASQSVRTARVTQDGKIIDYPVIGAQGVGDPPVGASLQRFEPSVGASEDGQFLVAWEEAVADSGNPVIGAQWFSAAGEAVGAPFEISSSVGGSQRAPKVTCAPTGECWVAWEQEAASGAGMAVRAQRFAADHTAAGLDFQLNTGTWDDLWLVQLAASDSGRVEARWEAFGGVGESRRSAGILGATFGLDGSVLFSESLLEAPLAQ